MSGDSNVIVDTQNGEVYSIHLMRMRSGHFKHYWVKRHALFTFPLKHKNKYDNGTSQLHSCLRFLVARQSKRNIPSVFVLSVVKDASTRKKEHDVIFCEGTCTKM